MLFSSKFRPAWWLRNPHVQTLMAARMQRTPSPVTVKERIQTPDSDFLDLNWTPNHSHQTDGPVVVIFHGLTGSIDSHYAKSLIHYLAENDVCTVLMHFRGCSGEPNNTPGSYHSGHTTDIEFIANTIRGRYPNAPMAAIGYSLGGNALLKYLATQPDNPFCFAASISPPLVLAEGAKRMNQGFSKVYQRMLIKQMKEAVRAKHHRYPEFKLNELNFEDTSTFIEFDHNVTAPLHGYKSGADYYRRASTLDDLINIKTPTHILWSRDDPFFTEACIPANEQLADCVDFELSLYGGHVGFVSGLVPSGPCGYGHNWLSARIGALVVERLGG